MTPGTADAKSRVWSSQVNRIICISDETSASALTAPSFLDVSKVITSQLDINIHKVTISTQNGIFDGTIELRVHDRDEVKVIIESLKKIEGLKEIQRIL